MTRAHIAIFALLAAALGLSVITDLRSRKILDIVTLPTLGLCLLLRLAAFGWGTAAGPGLASGLLGVVVGGALFLLLNLLGGMGMGDVKLTAAVGAGIGFPSMLFCLMYIGIVGGLEALVVLVWRGRLLHTLGGMARAVLQKIRIVSPDSAPRERTRVPYGVAIALGTAWWMLSQAPSLDVP